MIYSNSSRTEREIFETENYFYLFYGAVVETYKNKLEKIFFIKRAYSIVFNQIPTVF